MPKSGLEKLYLADRNLLQACETVAFADHVIFPCDQNLYLYLKQTWQKGGRAIPGCHRVMKRILNRVRIPHVVKPSIPIR